ncbi:hypothetical protein H8S44_03100 [Anaerosacchariphilus sp. NSJ-68]|uniref:Uncharacterized protein n=2 Tax=Lachnospiraceae TaxID=186803 RepID=A0A923LAR7_9FIRM|nr:MULTISPECIES: hypothetical protein [Lachnospiraceae]MBC5658760.1 hypothetical protein [Anaerosacchariphilus hominis]
MCEALEELFAPRLEERRQEGIAEGISQGISRLSALIIKLLDSNRIDDVKRVTEDPAYRDALFAEFNL